MLARTFIFIGLSLSLSACSEYKQKYRDTSYLEEPPRLPISEQPATEETKNDRKKSSAFVLLEDAENPPVLKIKKLFDRSWDLVGQALNKKKIEITDKNRVKGIYYVNYDPSGETGNVFSNVKIFLFEARYEEAEYELSIIWRDTATEVRAKMVTEQDLSFDEEDDELNDASAKLIESLYDAINEQLSE